MKKFLEIMTTGLAMTALLSVPAIAQTPDGETPAEEAVCDVLQADGTTKGLYGLCVAFCEAHDTAELSTPITPEELEALEASAPSGKILENYNRKKQDSDPGMPCLLVQEPESCPCFSSDELSSLDGLKPGGEQTDIFSCYLEREVFAFPAGFAINSSLTERDFNGGSYRSAGVVEFTFDGRKSCYFPGRSLSTNQGTLTPAEYEICRVKINNYIPYSGCPW